MAPELLGGHMLRSREGLLQTDVYSIALVLWEIYSRYENNKAGGFIAAVYLAVFYFCGTWLRKLNFSLCIYWPFCKFDLIVKH